MSAFNSDHILTSYPRARSHPLPMLPRTTALPSPRFIRGPAPSRSPPLRCPVLRHGAQTSMFEPSTNHILTSDTAHMSTNQHP